MEAPQLATAMERAARVVKAGNPDRSTLYRIFLADEDGQAIMYATDSYHAIRVDTGRTPPKDMGDKPVGLTLNPKSKATPSYRDLLDHHDTEHAMPATMASLFEEGRAKAVPYLPSVPRLPDMRFDTFGYFDGERRKPKGLIDVTFDTKGCDVDRIDVMFRRGLRVEPHDAMHHSNTGVYWHSTEPEREVMGRLETNGKGAERKRLNDGAGSMYAASYLWMLNGASAMGWVDELKPLYLSVLGGKVEHIIMPIRRAA